MKVLRSKCGGHLNGRFHPISGITSGLLTYGVAAFVGNFVAGSLVSSHLRSVLIGVGLWLAVATGGLALTGTLAALAVAAVILWGPAIGALVDGMTADNAGLVATALLAAGLALGSAPVVMFGPPHWSRSAPTS